MLIGSHRGWEQASCEVLSVQRYLDVKGLFPLLVLERLS